VRNPEDPQIRIRESQVQQRFKDVGARGGELGRRKSRNKGKLTIPKKRQDKAAAKQAKAAVLQGAVESNSNIQERLQNLQIQSFAPVQPANAFGQMQSQNQVLGLPDFRNPRQDFEVQLAAPTQYRETYFQQHPQNQQMYAPAQISPIQPANIVHMQQCTPPSNTIAPNTLRITDFSNITDARNALAASDGPVSFINPTMSVPTPMMNEWQKQKEADKIALQEHKRIELGLEQQQRSQAVHQQNKQKHHWQKESKQQLEMEEDTSEVLDPDRLPARYGTGPYVDTGFSSPELTRDHSTILTRKMLRERDARRQVLRKIINST
jgi:hypothetical protein